CARSRGLRRWSRLKCQRALACKRAIPHRMQSKARRQDGRQAENTPIHRLLGAKATVHNNVLARGKGCARRTEPKDGAGDLLRRADAASGTLRFNSFLHVGLTFAE